MTKLSLCMIAKDEEENIKRCLDSVKGLADEIIVVDTGSTDNTKKIAEGNGAKVFDFEWTDDFSEARNESLKHASGDWIIVLDADEVLEEKHKEIVRRIMEKEDAADGYVTEQRNYSNKQGKTGSRPNNDERFNYEYYNSSYVVRLFRNNPEYKFMYPVHEEVSIDESAIKNSGIVIHHFGNIDDEWEEKKLEKYTRILRKAVEKDAGIKVKYDLAIAEINAGNHDKAIKLLKEVWDEDPKHRLTGFMLGNAYKEKGDWESAEEFYKKQIEVRPKDPNAYINLGLLHSREGNLQKAARAYCDLLEVDPRNFLAYKNLFALYVKFKKYDMAYRTASTAYQNTKHSFFKEQLEKFKKGGKNE